MDGFSASAQSQFRAVFAAMLRSVMCINDHMTAEQFSLQNSAKQAANIIKATRFIRTACVLFVHESFFCVPD